MYERLTIADGIGAVQKYFQTFDITPTADGVVFAPPDANPYYSNVAMPERLRLWLMDLRLLRNMPVAYFVPDAALLPPESIRFFHIDPSWVDRVIDGVFAAANTGTVDSVFSASMLAMTRAALDGDLQGLAETKTPGSGWTVDDGMTGMLIRSELVRRWPDMIVRAYKNPTPDDSDTGAALPVLRLEPISKDLLIAIFGGTPGMVHVREPNVGVRFGVEENPPGSATWVVDKRKTDGSPLGGSQPVTARNAQKRTLNITNLAAAVGNAARMVALHLEQRPYVQEFKTTVAEPDGSKPFSQFLNLDGSLKVFQLRNGRQLNLAALQTRMVQLEQMYFKEKP